MFKLSWKDILIGMFFNKGVSRMKNQKYQENFDFKTIS
jgi:hypothetical protein